MEGFEEKCANWRRLDWECHVKTKASPRRGKAAAKLHMRLGLNGFLPNFAIVDTAGEHDNKRARERCADFEEGEVVVDKAYMDFAHLHDLDLRGVPWVTRAKNNLCCRAVHNLPMKKGCKVVSEADAQARRHPWLQYPPPPIAFQQAVQWM